MPKELTLTEDVEHLTTIHELHGTSTHHAHVPPCRSPAADTDAIASRGLVGAVSGLLSTIQAWSSPLHGQGAVFGPQSSRHAPMLRAGSSTPG